MQPVASFYTMSYHTPMATNLFILCPFVSNRFEAQENYSLMINVAFAMLVPLRLIQMGTR